MRHVQLPSRWARPLTMASSDIGWVATGRNTQGDIGELKHRGIARDADVIASSVVDQPRIGNVKGSSPTPVKSFVELLCRRYRLFIINEHNTSQLCDVCACRLVKTRAHSVRYWRCPHMAGGLQQARDGKRRHPAEQSKV